MVNGHTFKVFLMKRDEIKKKWLGKKYEISVIPVCVEDYDQICSKHVTNFVSRYFYWLMHTELQYGNPTIKY